MPEDQSGSPAWAENEEHYEDVDLEHEGDLLNQISSFLTENGIDGEASEAMMAENEPVQRAVIAEGPVTGRNVSATLMSRIKRAKAATQHPARAPGHSRSWSAPTLGPPQRPATSSFSQARGGLANDVSRFVADNSLDQEAETKLRAQPAWVQQAVIAEGTLTGRNPSAVLSGRIRRVVDGGGPSHMMPYRQPQADPVSSFVAENGIDQGAEQKLREQPFHVQQAVLSEGPCTGRNTSAILASRIRRIVDGNGYQSPARPTMHMAYDPISQFIADNSLDSSAQQKLLEQPMHVREAVLHEGPVTGRNPSAVLSARIRRIIESGGPQFVPRREEPHNVGYGMMWHAPPVMHYPPARFSSATNRVSVDEVRQFAIENMADEKATDALLEAPKYIQQAVLAEGGITGRNPSAILLSRLRRAQAQAAPDPISVFISENQLDEGAESKLREQHPSVQQAVLGEGPLTGSRNPSAVLSGRIRRILQNSGPMGGTPAAGSKRPRLAGSYSDDPIEHFLAENSINEDACVALRTAEEHIQHSVIEEGPITGRNTSAILLSRIRRAQSAGYA